MQGSRGPQMNRLVLPKGGSRTCLSNCYLLFQRPASKAQGLTHISDSYSLLRRPKYCNGVRPTPESQGALLRVLITIIELIYYLTTGRKSPLVYMVICMIAPEWRLGMKIPMIWNGVWSMCFCTVHSCL